MTESIAHPKPTKKMPKSTFQVWHEAFKRFLEERYGNAAMVASVLDCVENILPEILKAYFGIEVECIYDLTDCDELKDLRRKTLEDSVLKNLDREADVRFSEALKLYREFLMSAFRPSPEELEGEAEEETDAKRTAPTQASPRTTERTIFSEGEQVESEPEEHRRRNKRLREACIDFYKKQHGGRLVCECCGFDFKRAYGIEDEYIEVHHLKPFAHTDGEHEVCAETELVPLCANCHRMIHHVRGGKAGSCITLEELKERYRGVRYE